VEQRDLGRTGLRVSVLGFGCGAVGGLMVRGEPAEQTRAVERALEAGITYFDTAPVYGNGRSEENLGRVLSELGAWDRVVVGTKVRLAPEDLGDPVGAVRRSVEESLRRLDHDSVDLIQLHNRIEPASSDTGGAVAVDRVLGDIAEGFRRVVEAGLASHVGITALGDPGALRTVVESGRYATGQSYFNAVNPSSGFAGASGGSHDFGGIIDAAREAGVGIIVIRAYAAGALSAQPDRHGNAGDPGSIVGSSSYEGDLERARAVAALASEHNLESPLELGLRFTQSKPGVSTVLVGYSTFDHLESAIRWTERGLLADEVVTKVVEGARA
jgi:aryl-alcohol dehydrogenase-like predicted oxidoreductase